MARHSLTPQAGAFNRHFTNYSGLFFDEFSEYSAWIRETGTIRLPVLEGITSLLLKGEYLLHPQAHGIEKKLPGLEVILNGSRVSLLQKSEPGLWSIKIELPQLEKQRCQLEFKLTDIALTNALAYLGRVTGLPFLQPYRAQNKNRQLRLLSLETNSGELIYDFSQRNSPFSRSFARKHAKLGLNIVGFLTADLGVGESARCMVKAADAATIPNALVALKLNCKNNLGDKTYEARLQETNPYDVNVIHIDPPASRDIDHHHGESFRHSKYNIGYFAWELTEFPESWISAFDYYDEIWCPSEFSRQAISLKCPLPVQVMPHSIFVKEPTESRAELRKRFNIPETSFLFLTLFDLNSYSERKNPQASIEAFRLSGLSYPEAGLVIKIHNAEANPNEFSALKNDLASLPGTYLISDTLSRSDITALEAACDVFVSLHRAEGFGLALAECMALGKPVIATDFSATKEFITPQNGFPVNYTLTTLQRNVGPYSRGCVWAEPNTKHAAEGMLLFARDKALVAERGINAKHTISIQFSPKILGERYKARLEAIAAF
jgi:glycosyltransferase involved in cell wall biosynthesis